MDRRRSTHIIAKALGVIIVVAISGCQTAASRLPVKKAPPTVAKTGCKPDKYAGLIGQDKSVLDALKFPKHTRILGPNTMVTMDYSAERLNIHHNKAGKIIQFTCG